MRVLSTGTAACVALAMVGTASLASADVLDLPPPTPRSKGTAAVAGNSAIVPLAGIAPWSTRATAAIERALAAKSLAGVIGPTVLRARLRQAPPAEAALTDGADRLRGAEQATVAMERDRAITMAGSALDHLSRIGGAHAAPRLAARAEVTLGMAALLHPADEQRALQAFCRAAMADPSYVPTADLVPPRTAKLIEQARECADQARPATSELAQIATLAHLRALVWLRVAPIESGRVLVQLQLHRFDERGRALSELTLRRQVRSAQLGADLVAMVRRALNSEPAARGALLALQTPADPVPVAETAASSPWYGKWWVWAIAGAVVVGAGVGLSVGLAQRTSDGEPPQGDPTFDFHFSFP